MLLKILQIFLLFLAIGLCEINIKDLEEIDLIRDDYCQDYCGNKCTVGNASENDKTCTKTGNTVVTDKYEIKLLVKKLLITWKTNRVNLTLLKKLNTYPSKKKSVIFHIIFTETITEDTPFQSNQYMKALNLYYAEFTILQYKNEPVLIREFDVHVLNGPEGTNIMCPYLAKYKQLNGSTICNNYLSKRMSNLRSITSDCDDTLFLRNDTFQCNSQLTSITFYGTTLKNLNSMIFTNLTKLKELSFNDCILDNTEFLRSTTLQNNLEELNLYLANRIELKYFAGYKKLHSIHVNNEDKYDWSQQINNTNITAFICSLNDELCYFNIGINGVRCPSTCICGLECPVYQNSENQFIINCTRQGLQKIPELPIPSMGETYLYFESNGLRILPNTSLEGYDNLRRLYLANNNLTNIQINQLPNNLEWLDIRNNNITTLDPNVAAFLFHRRDTMFLIQSGIYWKCNCNNTYLLIYLKLLDINDNLGNIFDRDYEEIDNPVKFYHTRRPCPKFCMCCVKGSEDQFIINCTSKALETFPILPNKIIGEPSLLLDNNAIETLATSSLRNSTLRELHLKNNSLTHLHLNQLPSNLQVLDIRQNNLTGLDDDVTQFISKLSNVQLSGNPWQCSCKFTEFLAHLKKVNFTEYKAALGRCSGQEYCTERCTCCKEDESRRFIINCSNLRLPEIPAELPIAENATLLFEYNNLQTLDNSTKIKGFNQLKELHLRYNNLTKIEVLPEGIQLLDIRNNSLTTLNESVRKFLTQKANTTNLTIFISGNIWTCHCKEIRFFRFTKNMAENIKDLCKTECHDSRLFVSLEEIDLCPEKIPTYVIYFTSFIMLSCLVSFLQCFWKSIVMWLYEKRLFLNLTTRLEKGSDTKYDCFLAYCHKDSHLVREYVERLEHGRNRLRLCFYERDWLAGEPIPDCICHSVENSKCIVILMTKNFLKSVWGRLEFRLALHATSKDQYKRLIVIIYPGVENFDELDGELKSYLKLNTYLIRNDTNFWNKLIYALPHKMIDEDEEMEMINIET